jgi:tetratricopeptide (TPR) repeat protein
VLAEVVMAELIHTLIQVKNPLTLAAFFSAVLLVAFRTRRVPEMFFGLLKEKLTKEHFAQMLRRFMVLGFSALCVLCTAAVASQVLARTTEAKPLTLDDLRNELKNNKVAEDKQREAQQSYAEALARISEGQIPEAIAAMQRSVDQVPTLTAQYMLAYLYKRQGDHQNAREYATKAEAIANIRGDAFAKVRLERLSYTPASSPASQPVVRVRSEESEPNNDFTHANEISVGDKIGASIADGSDTDFYYFKTPAGPRDYYQVSITNGGETLHPSVYVYDGNRSYITHCESDQALAMFECPFSAQGASAYYVKFSGYSGTSGAYVLLIKPLKLYDRFEPNDDFPQAKSISSGTTIEANIMDGNDTDFYLVKAGATGPLTVTVENGGTTLHPSVYVYDGNRSYITHCESDQALAKLECPFSAQGASAYFVKFSGYSGTSGAYKLTVK